MGGHFMRGQFKTWEEVVEAIKGVKKTCEEEYNLTLEVAEIKHNRETELYELSVYFGK